MNAELDLLHSILDPSPTYPWNPYTPEGEAYLADLESQWDETGTVDAIAAGWQSLSAQLDARWPAETADRTAALVAALSQRFTFSLPDHILRNLAQQAVALAHTGRPLMEQLVQCVQSVLNGWDSDDLEVLARPLAYSLRDGHGDIVNLQLRPLQQGEWATLSEVEKARCSLAIASIALSQAKAQDETL